MFPTWRRAEHHSADRARAGTGRASTSVRPRHSEDGFHNGLGLVEAGDQCPPADRVVAVDDEAAVPGLVGVDDRIPVVHPKSAAKLPDVLRLAGEEGPARPRPDRLRIVPEDL